MYADDWEYAQMYEANDPERPADEDLEAAALFASDPGEREVDAWIWDGVEPSAVPVGVSWWHGAQTSPGSSCRRTRLRQRETSRK